LLYAYSRKTANSPLHQQKQKLHIAYEISWHNNVLDYKLRTDQEQLRLKILETLRTTSLDLEFTGSY